MRSAQTRSKTLAAKAKMAMRLKGRTNPARSVTPPDIQEGFETSTFCAPKAVRTAWMARRLAPQVASSVSSGRP